MNEREGETAREETAKKKKNIHGKRDPRCFRCFLRE